MNPELSRMQQFGDTLAQHGREMVIALAVLILGLLVARWIDKGLRNLLQRIMPKTVYATVACNVVYILLVTSVVALAAVEFGAKPTNIFRLLTIIALIAVGLILFLRPLLPSMPFKVGNTVKAGTLLGKVEAITFINTRLRTFDGKTFFVPNSQILNDVVINYHFTQTRRVKVDVSICYDQDLLKAKRVLEAVMTEDARVKTKPGPMVYVLNLAASAVELGGRCWVDNKDYWVARCELLEKTKLRFDQEGIRFAFPQLDLHLNPREAMEEQGICSAAVSDQEAGPQAEPDETIA
ncbi:mechanosensitive ion channel family protein [uncultured Desulfosarcina sp.]|uniref:mechanosensitive ion channel family protein n=1 Tax=uncultured Desulfosarcina sp. TaxID=218289 RepID=UPI0029C7CD27|nr:mechanosensitive ion channel family protein [uncultured Desulfosarcina sp.]